MRKIRIKLSPPDLSNLSNLQVIATSYMISISRDFDKQENIIHKNIKDRTNLFEYITDLDIGPKQTVYVRIMFHFLDINTNVESMTKWSRTTPISSDLSGFTLSDIIIRTPLLKVNRTQDTLTLETEAIGMYSGGAKHNSTTWQITDSSNVPIYQREGDRSNLTTLRTQGIPFKKNRAYMLKARHETVTDNKSNFGKKLLVEYSRGLVLFDVKILNQFIIGVHLIFKLTMYAPKFRSLDLEIRDLQGNVISSLIDHEGLTGRVNTDNLRPNVIYEIFVRVKFTDNQYTPYKRIYSGTCLSSNPDGIFGDGGSNYPGGIAGGADINFGDMIGVDVGQLENNPDMGINPDTGEKEKLKRQSNGVTST